MGGWRRAIVRRWPKRRSVEEWLETHEARLGALEQQLTDEVSLRVLAGEVASRVHDLALHAGQMTDAVAAQQRAMEGLEARIRELEYAVQVWSVMAYVHSAEVAQGPLVSVVMATRNRSGYVWHAVESVLAQSYPTWELLAVDDGSDDDTYEVLGAMDDDRVRRFRTPHRGLSAARNRALIEASGDYVAYLDDDNTMDPDWLRSIVWTFENWPQVDALYGAMIIDGAVDPQEPSRTGMPWLRFVPYDRNELERHNLTDIGAVAHRSGLPEAVFDEELGALEDWDLLLRLGRVRDLLALPVVAGTYTTRAPDRLSGSATWDHALRLLRSKHSRGVGSSPVTGA